MYFLHLSKENGIPITLDEWKSLIESDPDMRFSNTTVYTSQTGETVTKSGGFYGIWTVPDIGKEVALWLVDGQIHAVYDALSLGKMHELSSKLDGVVAGDMGEEL